MSAMFIRNKTCHLTTQDWLADAAGELENCGKEVREEQNLGRVNREL